MTIASALALFGAMCILAIIPGPGVFAVLARSMSGGFKHGAITVLGILLGDYIFIILSVFGLIALADAMGSFFVVVKYLGAAYLIWLAISLWRSAGQSNEVEAIEGHNFAANFTAGLITTLGNPKAILFYVGFFQAFFDVQNISTTDVLIIFVIATLSVGGVMLGYAAAVSKAKSLLKSPTAKRYINRSASGVMACSGIFMVTKA